MGSLQTWALIEGIVLTLVLELEPYKFAEVQMGLRAISSRVMKTTELQMVVPELILLLGEDSRALKALKMVREGFVGRARVSMYCSRYLVRFDVEAGLEKKESPS